MIFKINQKFLKIQLKDLQTIIKYDTLSEWLRRWPAKPLGFARTGSNPVCVVLLG